MPKLRTDEVVHAEPEGFTVTARTMLAKLTPFDGVRVALRFEPRVLPPGDVSLQEWLDDLRVEVTTPAGAKHTLRLEPKQQPSGRIPYVHLKWSLTVLHLDARGLRTMGNGDPERRWEGAPSELFAEPGVYGLRLSGRVRFDGRTVLPFASGELRVEVAPRTEAFRSVEELTRIAGATVFSDPKVLEDVLVATDGRTRGARERTLDDAEGNRWIWFTVPGPNEHMDVHLLTTPSGELLAYDQRSEFHCVASGTPIATPDGEVPIEALRPGDVVIGWDEASEREVETSVVSSVERPPVPVLEIDGAFMTARHPVLAARGWIDAGELGPGDAVRRRGGWGAVQSIALASATRAVHDLEVEWPDTYVAGGLVVHNKAAPVQGPDDVYAWILDRPVDPSWQKRRAWGAASVEPKP